MAAGRSALAVVLLACVAAPLLLAGGGVRAAAEDDLERAAALQPSWCSLENCTCTVREPEADDDGGLLQITVRCTYTGDKRFVWKSDSSGRKPEQQAPGKRQVVDVELVGDGRCNLTVRCPNRKTFGTSAWLRSFNATGFAEVTVEPQGLQIKNASSHFAVTIRRVGRLFLDTNAVQPQSGRADVLIEDCGSVRLNNGAVGNLRSFAFRRIDRLELAENTFKLAAAPGSAIERMILEDLTADKLPSHAFITTIDLLSITNCTFGTIERHAFPINTMVNVTLTNVTVNRMKTEAFQSSLMITNLRITGCSVREMETNAVMSGVQSIRIERSTFGSVQTSAVSVYNELVLNNNTFERVASHGFLLKFSFSVRVDRNVFRRLDADAFYEPSAVGQQQTRLELRFSSNVFGTSVEQRSLPQPAGAADEPAWLPVVRLQKTAVRTNVTDNLVSVPCGCGPWRFVAVTDGGENGTELDDGNDDAEFADRNHCRADVPGAAECANLTATLDDGSRRQWEPIDKFRTAAGCDRDAGAFDICVRERATKLTGGGGFGFLGDALTPNVERGVITTVVLLILCGFGCVCAVSAVTWLNARGYFIKLRSLLTSDRGGRTGFDGGSSSGGGMSRTLSAHSLSPMPVHEYAELQRHNKLSGSSGGSSELGVLVVVYQDRGTQTVPEELTPEMLQSLRDKLEVPEDYAEARGMIEHLYDLIRVEETCCGSSNTTGSSRGLEDMTSTITTRAVSVGRRNGAERRDVKSIGTNAPSLEKLWPPKLMNAAVAADWHRYRPPPPPPPPNHQEQPSVGEYMDPVDLFDGGSLADDGTELYCELADLRDDGPSPKPGPATQPRSLTQTRPPPQSRPPPPPPPSRTSNNSTKV